jgi:hypothetical protein
MMTFPWDILCDISAHSIGAEVQGGDAFMLQLYPDLIQDGLDP